jgi:hypothetical protein
MALVWSEAGNSSGSAAQPPTDTTSARSTKRIEVPHSFGIRRCMIACFLLGLHGLGTVNASDGSARHEWALYRPPRP